MFFYLLYLLYIFIIIINKLYTQRHVLYNDGAEKMDEKEKKRRRREYDTIYINNIIKTMIYWTT